MCLNFTIIYNINDNYYNNIILYLTQNILNVMDILNKFMTFDLLKIIIVREKYLKKKLNTKGTRFGVTIF